MKTIVLLSLVTFSLVFSSQGLDKPELDARIRKLQAKFEAMQANPEKRVPADKLQKAKAILLLDRTKAGFIFAFQGGSGVAMGRTASGWSPVSFYKANEASLGFQIGGQKSFMVILMMSTNSTRLLTDPVVDFGGEASGTAGDATAKAEGKISPTEPSVLIYDEKSGLYGGAALKGGAIEPDEQANRLYYGEDVTPREILFGGKVKASPRASELAARVTELSKAAAKPAE